MIKEKELENINLYSDGGTNENPDIKRKGYGIVTYGIYGKLNERELDDFKEGRRISNNSIIQYGEGYGLYYLLQ